MRDPIAAVAAVLAILISPLPANGQCRLCDTPTTSRTDGQGSGAIELDIQANLDFDRIIMSGRSDGAATIRPDGSNAAEGGVVDLGPRAMVGSVVVHGEAGRTVRVELPRRIELFSIGGSRITLDEVVSDLPSVPRLDSAGNLDFRFGGRIKISGDADGQYRGDLPITVEYL